jgi:hypothetical protein
MTATLLCTAMIFVPLAISSLTLGAGGLLLAMNDVRDGLSGRAPASPVYRDNTMEQMGTCHGHLA